MKGLYVSKTTSKPYFKLLYEESIVKPQQQDQNFHQMLIKGLALNDVDIKVLSSRPINRTNIKKIFVRKLSEVVYGIKYYYLPFVNITLFRQIWLFISSVVYMKWFILKHGRKDVTLICDPLNLSLSSAVILVSKLFKVKTIAVVTDLPQLLENKSNYYKKKATRQLQKYDSYVLLTEAMNQVINPKNKPHIVIEGMVPLDITEINKKKPKVFTVMYAGGLYESSGIGLLLDAMKAQDPKKIQLHIYGKGDLEALVSETSSKYPHIVYKGTLLNEEIIKKEREADLLINLRNPLDEFTKYSFPSKLMEYLSSGTAVLTTRLECIPSEYDPYLLYLDEYHVETLTKMLKEISEMDYNKLVTLGKNAKQFVQTSKSSLIQAQQVMKLWK